MKNEYQDAIDEQRSIEKKIEKSKVSFFNRVYNLSSDLRCVDITIIDQISHLSASVTATSYGKGIESIKAKLIIKDAIGRQSEVRDIIFRRKSNTDGIWVSENSELIMSQPIIIKDIVDVDIYAEKVIWEDFETEIIDEKQNVLIENPKDIGKLRKIIGIDIVSDYSEAATSWQCYCGERNQFSANICHRCKRDRREFSDIGNVEVLLDKLKECKTLLEAKELLGSFEDILGSALAEKVNKQIDKDLYIKKMYGMSDEKKAVLKYTELIVEG